MRGVYGNLSKVSENRLRTSLFGCSIFFSYHRDSAFKAIEILRAERGYNTFFS